MSALNIFDIPLYYISFNAKSDKEQHYRDCGFTNINHFTAIDGRKLDPKKLQHDNIISIRSYDDLVSGRVQHSGMPSLGAIGCSLSHYQLWKMCVDNDWPYITIAEEDNQMYGQPSQKDVDAITHTLASRPDSLFISINLQKNNQTTVHFFGTHFYIASKQACRNLMETFFPIDVQVDWYVAQMSTIGKVSLEGFPISRQNNTKGTSIQDECISCNLPSNNQFYYTVVGVTAVVILVITILVFVYRNKWKTCQNSCASYRASFASSAGLYDV